MSAYIRCGDFEGSDKSASAIYELFEDISNSLVQSQQSEWSNLINQIECKDETDNDMFRISKSKVPVFTPFLQQYIDTINKKYLEKYNNLTDPFDALLEDKSRTFNTENTNSETHDSDKYICAEDLVEACQHCLETGDDVVVFHDFYP